MASLWKILAGVGAAAAAPVTGGTSLGLILPAITATAGSGLISAGFRDSGGGGAKSGSLNIDSIIGKQSDISSRFLKEGSDLSQEGENEVDTSLRYLTRLLSGNRADITE